MAGQVPSTPRTTVFRVSCWTLGVVAFAEMLGAAVALAARLESSREVRIVERFVEVPKVVNVPSSPAPASNDTAKIDPEDAGAVVARPPALRPMPTLVPADQALIPPTPPPTPLGAPAIADPIVEKLVTEARQSRVAGDSIKAITKLNEAAHLSPDDPNVEFELGRVHEEMEVYDTASEHYQKVIGMGVGKAGELYRLAAAKLRDGFQSARDEAQGKLSLGRPRIYRDVNYTEGERVILTVPVQKAPGATLDDDFEVKVRFFDTLRGKEIVPTSEETSIREPQWVTGPIDWAGGEEQLRVTYIIPNQTGQNEHLFGKRTYYGQSVELRYKGELIDVQAWPRDLAARIEQPAQPKPNNIGDLPPEFLDKDMVPPDWNPGSPLLPPMPPPQSSR